MSYFDILKGSKELDAYVPNFTRNHTLEIFMSSDNLIEKQLVCVPMKYGNIVDKISSREIKDCDEIVFLPGIINNFKGYTESRAENSLVFYTDKIPLEIDSLILAIIIEDNIADFENSTPLDIGLNANEESVLWKSIGPKNKKYKASNMIVLGRLFREGYDNWIIEDKEKAFLIPDFDKDTIIKQIASVFI